MEIKNKTKADIKIKARKDKNKNAWMLSHMILQMVRFGMLDLKIRGEEDNSILLAKAIGKNIGKKIKEKLIRERGPGLFVWPFEESMDIVLIDSALNNSKEKKPYSIVKTDICDTEEKKILENFSQGLSEGGKIGLIIYTLDSGNSNRFSQRNYGMMYNTHHQLEAVGKALGRIIRALTEDEVPKLKPFKKEGESKRISLETEINLKWKFNGVGKSKIELKVERDPYYNMETLTRGLKKFARAGNFDFFVKALGDDEHHTYEDLSIVLGNTLNEMLGDRKGIMRTAFSILPLAGGVVILALDLGRGYCRIETDIKNLSLRSMVHHFFETFSRFGKMDIVAFGVKNSHPTVNHLKPVLVKIFNKYEMAKVMGKTVNDQILATNMFSALGKALGEAIKIDTKRVKEIPSTKGLID